VRTHGPGASSCLKPRARHDLRRSTPDATSRSEAVPLAPTGRNQTYSFVGGLVEPLLEFRRGAP
jgi:hypothetical protein